MVGPARLDNHLSAIGEDLHISRNRSAGNEGMDPYEPSLAISFKGTPGFIPSFPTEHHCENQIRTLPIKPCLPGAVHGVPLPIAAVLGVPATPRKHIMPDKWFSHNLSQASIAEWGADKKKGHNKTCQTST